MSKKRSRGWCFTVQSWEDEAWINVSALYECDYNCTYLIIGFETAPRTHTKHLQCYIYYREAISFRTMCKKLEGVHIEPQKSKLNVKAYCYCMEDGDWYEYGSRPRQGHRTDLEVIKHDMLDKKKPIKDIANEYFSQWCQYRRSFDEYIRINGLEPKYETKVIVYNNENPEHVKYIYSKATPSSYMQPWVESNLSSIYHLYYSKKYDIIFIQQQPWIEKLVIPYEIVEILDNGDL